MRLSRDAARDLEAIHDFIAEHDSPLKASRVLDRLMECVDSLASVPERGSHPRELLALGVRDYRQVFFKPYRVVYWVVGDAVHILLIADGRRDMQSLLMQRLLGA
ncbi:MAG TPA: type II toxin-antitoxin system RelE/ParE family toxin [Luteimonas sp.]|nr:type II toxin-antitoxin system RelE/ParE family toxin [Luteimonas sp.]